MNKLGLDSFLKHLDLLDTRSVQVSERIEYLEDLGAQFPNGAPSEPRDDHARYLRVREVLSLWRAQSKPTVHPAVSTDQLELRLIDLSSERESRRQRTAHLDAAMALVNEYRTPHKEWASGSRVRLAMFAALIGLGAGFWGMTWWPGYIVSGLCFIGAIATLRRASNPPKNFVDTRARAERLLVGQDLPGNSLEQRFDAYREITEDKERDHDASVADADAQLEAARRDEAIRFQQQAQRYEARDALSAATISIGATSQDDASQDVELLESWCQHYVAHSEDLERKADQWKRLQIEQERTSIDKLIEQQAELAEWLAGYEGGARSVSNDEFREIDNEIVRVRESRAELSGQLNAASQQVSVAEAEVVASEAQRELVRIRRLDETLSATAEILVQAEEAAYRSVAPRIQRRLGVLVSEATKDRYKRLSVNPEDLLIRIETEPGEWRDAQQLSHGTVELVYLLLRIVLAEQLCATGEIAPLFFDDVTVHFDSERTVGFLELLHKLSLDRQIVIFSQEVTVETWARNSLSPSQVLRLDV